ncbi:hypothetical protein [Spirosoma gilvum]
MKKIFLLCVFFIGTLQIKAQEAPIDKAAKAIYLEGLGSGLGVSLNYDTRFKPGLTGLGIRAGIGGIRASSNVGSAGLVTFPVMINYVVGSNRVAFEAGIGFTPVYVTVTGTSPLTGDRQTIKGIGLFGGVGNVGMRLKPTEKGVHFRIYYSPFITSEGLQPSWFGMSLGYGFR